MRNTKFVLLVAALALVISACGTELPPAPLLDANSINTAAAQTIAVEQATQMPLQFATPTSTGQPFPPVTAAIPNTGTTPLASGSTVQACDNLTYVSDVTVPDGTVMLTGQQFVKTWAVENTGSCAWTTDYQFAFVDGDAMGGTSAFLAAAVSPGTTAELSVNLTAPTTPGTYKGSWRMKNAAGVYFGNTITVLITVGGGGKGSTDRLVAQGDRIDPV